MLALHSTNLSQIWTEKKIKVVMWERKSNKVWQKLFDFWVREVVTRTGPKWTNIEREALSVPKCFWLLPSVGWWIYYSPRFCGGGKWFFVGVLMCPVFCGCTKVSLTRHQGPFIRSMNFFFSNNTIILGFKFYLLFYAGEKRNW